MDSHLELEPIKRQCFRSSCVTALYDGNLRAPIQSATDMQAGPQAIIFLLATPLRVRKPLDIFDPRLGKIKKLLGRAYAKLYMQYSHSP